MKLLPNRLGIRIRCDFMFNYFWINRPGKNVAELFEKICVDLNLFGGTISSNEDILWDTMVSGYIDR
jgi:hypothetical protein